MSDGLILTIGLVVALGASFGCVAVINRIKQRPDVMQAMLNRQPMFGKDFFDTYYPQFPRRIVFDVRSEFSNLIGVPADFVLPEDRLMTYAPPRSEEAMRVFVLLMTRRIRGGETDVVVPAGLSTLDDYIRAATQLCGFSVETAGAL